MKLPHLALVVSLFAISVPTFAQAPAAGSTPVPRLAEADKKFIKDFVEQHLAEQALVEKARGKEMSMVRDNKPSPLAPGVSTLYKKLHKELTTSWTELATLSQAKKVEITTTAKPADASAAAAVGKLSGEKFDAEFVKTIGKEAKKADTLLTTAGKTVRDAEVKAFIDKWAPTYKAHLTDIDTTEKALKAK
jgi:putative membrane protein